MRLDDPLGWQADRLPSRYQTFLDTPHVHQATGFLESSLLRRQTMEIQEAAAARVLLGGFTVGRLTICSVQFGVPAIAWMESSSPSWIFSSLLQGHAALGADAPYEPGRVAVAYGPGNMQEVRMDADARVLNFGVDETDLNNSCRSLLGSDLLHPLHFPAVSTGPSPQLAAFERVVSRLATTPRYEHPANQRLEAALQEAALFELLLAWPNSYRSYFDCGAALPRSTLRARDYIRAHAAELPTLGQIANAAGVGARALTMSFNKHLKVSPMRYLLQCRLDGARADLLLHREQGMVGNTACKWGFFNLGHFAGRYRERFGELPHQTLRRVTR
ncbi:helix-turn-helix transcriptional regulator [Pseudoduganella rivuli]|nr:helix-turn-helix transcriptional regulator [Pseudoduganella rivuli]